jgi:uncharacterized membrane protein
MTKTNATSRVTTQLLDLQRLLFLIDGVFAITITLLVLDLKLPAGPGPDLPLSLVGVLPRFLVYLFAFVTIANQWIFHHRIFRLVQHADGRLVLLTFGYLLFITLIPFTAGLVGGYPTAPLAAACFSANILFLCLAAWAIWSHLAQAPHLLLEGAAPLALRQTARVWVYIASGFALAIPLGLISVHLAFAIWLIWPISAVWVMRGASPSRGTGKT